ncbi:protein translocase subunit SecF [Arcanobacterium hippocoleae]|uniref:Protein-export membrane protein SecF n=1 Tax=Arcanobacterium hippocoleae TaxID=149017 RepID=A0ABU1T020_9ACTO|nr:protein translocase subunit SecF [Arcanobacterium hippocoleae]MDR6938732.1 preprotein translocase subunit SecF [Arcanobacterium hippocoleae]
MSMYSFGNSLYSGRRSFNVIGKRNIWFGIAIVAIVISLLSFAIKSPNLGIEFRGGSQFTVSGAASLSHDVAYQVIKEVGKDDAPRVSTVGTNGVRVQTVQLDDQQTQQVKDALAKAYAVPVNEVTSTYIGPSWGQDILSKAIRAMIVFMVLVSIVMIGYFRSWTIAVGAIGALLHDFVVTLGVYWILGLEITPATIIGILTILGYSLYDTVVVFDKVRENTQKLRAQSAYTFAESANLAINQTLIRSLNTSLTGLLPVISVLFIGVGFLGADTLRDLALVMFVGMILSTLSSIFLAAPLAVALGMRNKDIRSHTEMVEQMRKNAVEIASNNVDAQTRNKMESDMLANAGIEERVAGGHLGQRSQPKRKKRNKK